MESETLTVKAHMFKFLVFTVLGSGPSWTYGSLLIQEIAYFENTQPEELCMGSWMNVMVAYGLSLSLLYFVFIKYVYAVPHEIGMPVLMAIAALSTFGVAFTWSWTVDVAGEYRSISLYFFCFLAGTIGSLMYVILLPFMTAYDDDAVTYARAGCDTLAILISLVSVLQNTGSTTNVRFGPTAFYLGFGFYMLLPLLAYFYVVHTKLGLRVVVDQKSNSFDIEDDSFLKVANLDSSVLVDSLTSETTRLLDQQIPPMYVSAEKVESFDSPFRPEQEVTSSSSLQRSEIYVLDSLKDFSELKMSDEDIIKEESKWLLKLLPLMVTVGFIDFNTWGVLPAVLPFAFDKASPSHGSFYLSCAYQLATFTLVAGDLSTTLIKLPRAPCLLFFSITTGATYVTSLGLIPDSWASFWAPLLVVVFSMGRFVEAHLLTQVFVIIASKFPAAIKERATRFVGLADIFCITCGSIVSSYMVGKYAQSC